MKRRIAALTVLVGITLGTPAAAFWDVGGDEVPPTTEEVVAEAPPDPPTTEEEQPSTNPSDTRPTPQSTVPPLRNTTPEPPTTTGTAATPNTGGATTLSPPTATTTPTQTTSEPGQSESPPPHDEGAFAAPELVKVFSGPLLLIVPLNVETTTTTTTMPSNKVFVCKYEGTPGIDERLQTGQNPISVAWQPGRSPGEFFNDAQGRSYSLAWDIGQDEPDPNECPPPNTGTTTTTSSTTTSTTTTTLPPTTTTSSTTTTLPPTTTTSSTTTTTIAPTTTTIAPTTTTEVSKKWFVCKAVRTPGTNEIITHVISVNENAIPDPENDGVHVGDTFSDAQSTSVVIAEDVGQPEPELDECFPTPPTTTTTSTTTLPPTTTTSSTTTTTGPTTTTSSTTTTTSSTTTTLPTSGLFAIEVAPLCPDGTSPEIEITFGDRPDLDGQVGTLTFSTGGSTPLTFDANGTTTIPYPTSAGTGPVTMTYTLGAESVSRTTDFPEACEVTTSTTTTLPTGSTTTTSLPPTTTTSSSTSTTTSTSTTPSTTTSSTTTTVPFTFGAAATVCVAEVPTIRINFQNTFPELAGQTGTLTMEDINGNVVSTQSLVYQPGTTVDLLYPGTSVNADGSIDDVPGWILTDDGFWIRDPSDEFLREGIFLTYTVNPTAGPVLVTYPPESSTCANPDGPFPPGEAPPLVPGQLPPTR